MALYMKEKLTRDVQIHDSRGRPMPAMKIFVMVIQNLKDCARAAIGDNIANIQDSDIHWVLTVPAIWSDSAKQFMREAALQAGIAENQLQLALEPEAASLFCKEEPFMRTTNPDQTGATAKMSEGHKYILADLGGGTADICIHQIVTNGNLRELQRAMGDALGGICVDNAFQQFFIKLIGADTWMAFKQEYMDEYLHMMRMFDSKRNSFSTNSSGDIVLSLPNGLMEKTVEHFGKKMSEIIPETNYSDCISVDKRNKLKISVKVMESFFKPTVEGVVKVIKDILMEKETEDIQTLLMVGGFSESPYLGEVIKSQITGVKVIFPPEGSLAVLKGAVLMGYKAKTIVERKARFSYGIRFAIQFQEGIHPASLKVIHDGKELCDMIFAKVITKGEVLTTGQVVKHSGCSDNKTKESKHVTRSTTLYRSAQPDPTYCTEEGRCSEVGEIEMKPPKEGWPDEADLEYQLIVGETEFTMKVFNKTTGAQYEAKMDFL